MTKTLDAQYSALWQRLIAANTDLVARFQRLGGTVYYDPDDDWLIVTIGPPVEAVTFELTNHLNLRYDPDTLKLVATEVTDLAAHLATHPQIEPTARALVAIGMRAPSSYVPIGAEAATAVAKDLGQLVQVSARLDKCLP